MNSSALNALVLAPLALVSVLAVPAGAQSAPPSPTPPCDHCGNTPTPTMTPHSDRACPSLTVQQPPTPTSGQEVSIPVAVSGPSATYTVSLTRESPAPVAVVRSATATSSTTFTVRLGESHRFTVSASSPEGCIGGGSGSVAVVVPVRAAVSIAATRTAVRAYTFTGRVQPAYGTVSLYRVEDSGRRVLTSRTDVTSTGAYRIDRRFTGSGRFGFVAVADAGSTGRYSSGSSPVRPTVIH